MKKTRCTALILTATVSFGCANPMSQKYEDDLRSRLLSATRTYTDGVAADTVIRVVRPVSEVERDLDEQRRIQLDATSGPTAYRTHRLDVGPDLSGNTEAPTVAMTLRRVVHSTVENNLNLKVARLVPAIDETIIAQAEAAFDAVFFTNFNWQKLDTPQPPAGVAAFGTTQTQTTGFATGIRKPLTTGGQVTVQTGVTRNYRDPSFFNVRAYDEADVTLSITQPLLRNFGSDVNMAQIELTRSSRRQDVQDLRRQVLEASLSSEQAYWELVFSRQRLLIQTRLLERTIRDRDMIARRADHDAPPSAITEANSFVEARMAEVIRAQQEVRRLSDVLKRLINEPDMPISGETLIVPLDFPADAPLELNLLDAVTNALRHRPELRRALLEIDDAAVRQRVADNQRLPVLNLSASMSYTGLGLNNDLAGSYENLGEGDFIDYIIGLQFEAPLGNRRAEAQFSQRRIERQAAVINYQNQAQNVVLEVKNALRELITSYRLIGAESASRRAAADYLRALEVQEEAGAALTPEFIDLKLRRQETLANAETREMRAMIDYNVAMSRFYFTTGTLLEHNGIQFSENK